MIHDLQAALKKESVEKKASKLDGDLDSYWAKAEEAK